MVILFEIISIYKSVTMIKRVYKIGEYFLRPHTISVSLEKQSRDFFHFRCSGRKSCHRHTRAGKVDLQ